MRLIVASAVVLWVGLVAACGAAEEGPDRSAAGAPAERLAAALTALAEAGSGSFDSRTSGSGGTRHSAIEGVYRLSPPAAAMTVTRYLPGLAPLATEVLAIGRDAWSRDRPSAPDGPKRCWVRHDVTMLFDSGLLTRNGDTYFPASVAVAARGRGAATTGSLRVSGTTELTAALSVASTSLPTALGISSAPDHRVPAVFTVDDGVLSGWDVSVRDVLERAREVSDRAEAVNRLAAAVGSGGRISTDLSAQGDPVDLAPPPRDEVVDYTADRDALEAAVRSCTADLAGTDRPSGGGGA